MKAHFASRNRLVRRLVLPALAALACSGGDASEESLSTLELGISVDQVLGFEVVSSNPAQSDWVFGPGSSGSLSSSTTHTEGLKSLQISNLGWAQIQSTRIGPLGQVGANATFDIRVSGTGTIPWGDAILQLDAPSQGLLNQQAGQKLLGGLAKGTWHSISIPLSQTHRTKLSAPSLTDLSVRFSINLPSGSTVLLDRASFGQPPGASGGTGGTGGSGGSSGASGAAGSSGAGGVAGASGSAGAASGSAGTSGSGGSSGAGNAVEFFFQLPNGVTREALALDAYGGSLTLEDYSKIITSSSGFSSASAVASTTTTSIGAHAELQSLWSQPNVLLKSNSRLHGSLTTQGTLTKQTGAIVDGTTAENTSLDPLQRPSWLVTFPSGTLPTQTITTTRTFAPGSYGGTTIKPSGKLILSAGKYTFKALSLEGGGTLEVDNRNGPVFIYVETTLGWNGTATFRDTAKDNVLFGVAGTSSVTLVSSLRGVLVAPYADVTLGACTPSHQGAFFAKSIKLAHGGVVKHRPLTPVNFCDPNATTCDGLCPCDGPEGTCDSDSDCEADLVCWKHSGRHYGRPADTSLCAPPECALDIRGAGCGEVTSPCGLCEGSPTPCSSNADCVAGEVCGENGIVFASAAADKFCWPPVCSIPATTRESCGSSEAPCGHCDCSANCAGKVCGDDPADECGGICAGLCVDGEPGCTDDAQCVVGSICGLGQGPRFGHGNADNVCMPRKCLTFDPALPGCGVDGDPECGSCVEQADCAGKECSEDGVCGSCGAGDVCSGIGRCVRPRLFEEPTDPLPGPLPDPMPRESTSAVGALHGEFNVTDRGNARYRIPIVVPPGRMGLEPDIGFEYLSTRRDGFLGMGWRLDGLSIISRCPRAFSRAAGTAARPVDYTPNDALCMDGKRLINIAGNEYRTEVDSFKKIELIGNLADGHFVVYEPGGRILTYGLSTSSRVVAFNAVRIWGISTIEDRTGNAIAFSYLPRKPSIQGASSTGAHGTTELLPTFIGYTKRDSDRPAMESAYDSWIRFSYEPRPDKNSGYTRGSVGHSLNRIASVQVFGGGVPVRTYRIDYDEFLGNSRIRSFTECAAASGGEDEVCKSPTTFDYFEEVGFGPATSAIIPNESIERVEGVLDYNGDGRDDLLVALLGDVESEWERPRRILLAGDEDEVGFELGPFVSPSPGIAHCLNRLTANVTSPQTEPGFAVMDVNRDGRDDLVCDQAMLVAGVSGFYEVELTAAGGLPRQTSGQTYLRQAADTNGDGIKDVVSCSDAGLLIWLGTGSQAIGGGFSGVPQRGGADRGSCRQMRVLDTDGDGDEEAMIRSNGAKVYALSGLVLDDYYGSAELELRDVGPFYEAIFGGGLQLDVNGDGLRDIAQFESGSLYNLLNTGKGFATESWITAYSPKMRPIPEFPETTWPLLDFRKLLVIDLDHDGRDDLAQTGNTFSDQTHKTRYVRFAFDGIQGAILAEDHPLLGSPWGTEPSDLLPGMRPLLADLDRDGERDVVTSATRDQINFNLNRSRRNWLLKTIRDGLGKTTTVSYDLESGGDLFDGAQPTYDPGSCVPWEEAPVFEYDCVRKPGPLVSEHRIDDGVSAGLRFLHYYEEGRTGLAGRGPFGFRERTTYKVSDQLAIASTSHVTFHNTRFDLAGKVETAHVSEWTTASPLGPAVLRRVTTTNGWERLTSGSGRPFVALRSKSLETTEGGAVLSRTDWGADWIDEWGNVEVQSSATYLRGTTLVERSSIETPVTENLGDWLLRLPDSRATGSVRLMRNGTSEAGGRLETYSYYTSGLLREIVREPGDAELELTTTLDRDEFGNVVGIHRRSAASVERFESVDYGDEAKVLPVATTDAAGHTTDFRYDTAFGALITVRDANLLVEQRAYDGFGRVRRIVTPTEERTVRYEPGRIIAQSPIGGFATAWHSVSTVTGGGTEERDFDAFNRTLRTLTDGFDGVDVMQEFRYDWAGRLVDSTQPNTGFPFTQGLHQYTYDNLNRRTSVTRPDGSVQEIYYSSAVSTLLPNAADARAVELIAVVEPKANLTITSLDHNGAPVRIVEGESIGELASPPVGTRYEYGPFGILRRALDPQSHQTTVVSDGLGRKVSQDDPSAGHHTYDYTPFGELELHVDGNGRSYHYEYDDLSRLTAVRSSVDLVAEYKYDEGPNGVGRRTSEWRQRVPAEVDTDGNLQPGSTEGSWTRYEFEPLEAVNRGRLKRIHREIPGESQILTTIFDYDPLVPSHLQTIGYPAPVGEDGFGVLQEYDEAGHLKVVRGSDGEVLWQLTSADEGIRPAIEQFGNDVETNRQYFRRPFVGPPSVPECSSSTSDSCFPGHLVATTTTSPLGVTLSHQRYHFDRNGNMSKRVTLPENATETFSYDARDQLKRHDTLAGAPVPAVGYNYDDLGNIETVSSIGGGGPDSTEAYAFDPTHPYQVTSVTRVGTSFVNSYVYDGNGAQIERIGPGIPDGRQRLSYNDLGLPYRIIGGDGGTAQTTMFEYDGSGRRIARRTEVEDTLYAGDLYERRKLANTDTEHRYRIFALGKEVANVVKLQQSGLPIQTTKQYLHDDALGSVTLVTDQDGEVIQTRRQLSAFGAPAQNTRGPSGSETGYTGHQQEFGLGLVNMRGRFYDPQQRRFLSPDPFVVQPFSGGLALNRYAYVRNNPLRYADPSGFMPVPEGGSCSGCGPSPEIGMTITVDTGNGQGPSDTSHDGSADAGSGSTGPDRQGGGDGPQGCTSGCHGGGEGPTGAGMQTPGSGQGPESGPAGPTGPTGPTDLGSPGVPFLHGSLESSSPAFQGPGTDFLNWAPSGAPTSPASTPTPGPASPGPGTPASTGSYPLGTPDYTDLNITVGYWLGVTGGVFFSPSGINFYAGGGFVSPGGSVSLSGGWGSVSPGHWTGQGAVTGPPLTFAGSYGGGSPAGEVGFAFPATPGGSATAYYTW